MSHSHDHHHHHSRRQNIGVAAVLNVSFSALEAVAGVWTGSLAVLSDALHDLGDSVALVSSWWAEKKAEQPGDARRTFGYQRMSLLSALLNAVILLSGSAFILVKAVGRLMDPEPVKAGWMIGIALVGLAFNGLGAWKLTHGESQNEKVLTWHLLEDVLGWLVVLVGAIVMFVWSVPVLDPILTIGVTLLIVWGVIQNVRGVFQILMQGVPQSLEVEEMRGQLKELEEVRDVHDVHLWSLEGETNVFTGHIAVSEQNLSELDELKLKIKKILHRQGVSHSTIEFETQGHCHQHEHCELEG